MNRIAWSPSAAREALRHRIYVCVSIHDRSAAVREARAKGKHVPSPAQWMEQAAEKAGALDSPEAFEVFCQAHIRFALEVRL